MPLLRIETTAAMPEEKQKALLATLSKIIADTIVKPETYVMVTISKSVVQMSGKYGDAAFADVRSIGGLTDDVNRKLSQQISQVLKDSMGIVPGRVYLNFTEVSAGNWGWNGSTFA